MFKKLNFYKTPAVKPNPFLNDNDDINATEITTSILPENPIEHVASTSGSVMNEDLVCVTDDIINRKFHF